MRTRKTTVFTVLFEDTAAMLGLLTAFFGVLLGEAQGIPELDGVASLIIGAILALERIRFRRNRECGFNATGSALDR